MSKEKKQKLENNGAGEEVQTVRHQLKTLGISEVSGFEILNTDCVERIFSYLTLKDKLKFRKVSSTWETLFKSFWKITKLDIKVHGKKPSCTMSENIVFNEFFELLSIGGYRLKHLQIETKCFGKKKYLRGCINDEPFVIVGGINIHKFLLLLCDVCDEIEDVAFVIPHIYVARATKRICDLFRTLVERNNGIIRFRLHALDEDFVKSVLQVLPKSVKEVRIPTTEKRSEVFCQWLSDTRNLTTLSLDVLRPGDVQAGQQYFDTKKLLQGVASNVSHIQTFALTVYDRGVQWSELKIIGRLTQLRNLTLKIVDHDIDVELDEVLVSISLGCKNLKKVFLHGGECTSRGVNGLLNNLQLTHLHFIDCGIELTNNVTKQQETLESLELSYTFGYHTPYDYVNEDALRNFFAFKNLKEIQFVDLMDALTDGNIVELCASCRLLEQVSLIYCRNVTDKGIHHLLTALPRLKTLILEYLKNFCSIIPLDIESVESNVHNVRLASYYPSIGHSCCQLKLLKNLRILTIGPFFDDRILTNEEIEAIVSGCERIEELHYKLEAKDPSRDVKYSSKPEFMYLFERRILNAEKQMIRLMRKHSNFRLATIEVAAKTTKEVLILEKKSENIERIVKSRESICSIIVV